MCVSLFLLYSNLLSCIGLPLFLFLDLFYLLSCQISLKKKKKLYLFHLELLIPSVKCLSSSGSEEKLKDESSDQNHHSQLTSLKSPSLLPSLSLSPISQAFSLFITFPVFWSLQPHLKDLFCFLLSPTYTNLTCILPSPYVSQHSALPSAHSPSLHHKCPETSLVRVKLSLKLWEIEEKDNSPAMSFGRRELRTCTSKLGLILWWFKYIYIYIYILFPPRFISVFMTLLSRLK